MAYGVGGWPAKSFLNLPGGNGKLHCPTWINVSVYLSVCLSVMQGKIDTYACIKIRASRMLMSERWTEREMNIAPVAIPTKFVPYTH